MLIDTTPEAPTMKPKDKTKTDSGYSFIVASEEFVEFVLDQLTKKGWQGRVKQRWEHEMADLIEHQKTDDLDDETAKNYVYGMRTKLRDALQALPSKDPRRDQLPYLEYNLETPAAFLKRGKRLELSVALSEFAAYAVSTALRGWKNWKTDVAERWEEEQATFAEKTPATRKNYITRYRKAVRQRLEEEDEQPPRELLDELMEIVAHDPDLTDEVNARYGAKVRGQMRNLILVEHWREIVEAFQECLESDNPKLLLIGIMGVTGRRMHEVSTTGTFTPVYEQWGDTRVRHKYVLNFTGQAKTRGAEGTKYKETFRIPCLAPARMVLDAFHRLRSSSEGMMWKDMDNTEFNARVNGTINRNLRSHPTIARFWPKEDRLMGKCLRSLYAEIAYQVFAPSSVAKTVHYAQTLGHGEKDTATSLSYMDYTLKIDDQEEARREIQRLIDELDRDHRARGKEIRQPEDTPPPATPSKDGDDFAVIEEI